MTERQVLSIVSLMLVVSLASIGYIAYRFSYKTPSRLSWSMQTDLPTALSYEYVIEIFDKHQMLAPLAIPARNVRCSQVNGLVTCSANLPKEATCDTRLSIRSKADDHYSEAAPPIDMPPCPSQRTIGIKG